MATPLLKLVTPAPIFGNVPPRRRHNVEVRPREYLTEAEVEKLRKAAGDNRHGHRDATDAARPSSAACLFDSPRPL
jgi:type 1 fimbriae regulatory protein FimB/type 1 fimbriae regulatory protein FimE